ncbi:MULTISPECIES: aldo/keto reductase [unclassified Streptomyces]|uniref:aldo/keto reductase n=1 Tax=unclassified Streptomyces TaxID=2593676 RepID=UPI00224EC95E|nr:MULTISPECIES: aldo/keto reductase [unclassified Streptomyces]MCX4392908.1 aldo/keto reductase [Streptomyces sp. NBC_01767]MCX5105035.1 aldo/keto reductase [Streptomyces sp. NBC_00439]WSG54164.1 aldo/keto reductase [Streptomyces sp. NBC_01732]WSP45797.1 aldo/keto reductase [Streptomyces sp. NBC_01243]
MSSMSRPLDETFLLGGEVPVRRLGYGTAQLTGPGYWGPRGEREDAVAVLRAAVEQGVTLFDTADNYGPGLAEELVAEALHPYRDGLVIATKGGVVRTSDTAWHIAGRPEQLRAMCEASLRRLRTDRIDLYQLHRLDPDVPMADQLGTLDELRQEGKIRHIGLDTLTADQLEQALSLTGIASVQNRFNLLDRSSDAVLKVCEAHGLAFLPWFPLANGALTGDAAAALAGIADRHGATRGQIALAWLLHRSPVLCPTPGTGSTVHLTENLGAREIRLSAEDLSSLEALAPA